MSAPNALREYDDLPPAPESIDPARLPPHLRENPAMQAYLNLPASRLAALADLAARTAPEDAAVASQPVASLR